MAVAGHRRVYEARTGPRNTVEKDLRDSGMTSEALPYFNLGVWKPGSPRFSSQPYRNPAPRLRKRQRERVRHGVLVGGRDSEHHTSRLALGLVQDIFCVDIESAGVTVVACSLQRAAGPFDSGELGRGCQLVTGPPAVRPPVWLRCRTKHFWGQSHRTKAWFRRSFTPRFAPSSDCFLRCEDNHEQYKRLAQTARSS